MTEMAQSHYRLGMNYFQGKGVEKSFPEALKWFRLAATSCLLTRSLTKLSSIRKRRGAF